MKKRILFVLLTFVMLLCMTPFAVTATGSETAGVASINGTTYETFAEALNVANALTGDVTVEVSGSVEFVNGMELKGNYSSIKFVGTTDTATITINQSAGGDYLEAHGKTVAFEDLTLAKANPAWSGNSGHMGNYFSIQGGTATYTNCTFANGACTSGGTATYNSCTFKNASEYGIWVYDDALVTVNGGTIDSKKGIKVYSEDELSVTSTLTVENATFTENVTAKPAVAIGYAESVTLIGNTYNNTTPVLELDSGSDADCEGIAFVAKDAEGTDISATITAVDRNGNAACGVLVNGNIYTTVAEAAKDAKKGDTVTLLHASTETVELPEGTTLDTNGHTAENVTIFVPVVKIGDKGYHSLQEALDDCVVGDNYITILDDITENVVITQKAGVNIVIDGNDNTFTGVMTVFGNGKQSGSETLTIKNIVFQAVAGKTSCIVSPDRSVNNLYSYSHNVTVDNCTFKGAVEAAHTAAAIRHEDGGDKNWTITNCTVDENMHSFLQVNNVAGKLVIDNCTVNSKNGVNLNACTNVEITDSDFDVLGYALRTGVSTGGNLGEAKAIVLNNNTLMSSGEEDAVIVFRASSVDSAVSMKQNVVSGTTHISGNTTATKLSVDKNYWDGGKPVVDGAEVVVNNYYADAELSEITLVPRGSDFTGYTSATKIWGEAWGNATESFVIKVLDANGNVMGTTSLNNINGIIDGDVYVTWSIDLDADSNSGGYWDMKWITAPSVDNVPTKVVLCVDGVDVGGGSVQLNAPDNLSKIYVATVDEDGKILSYHTSLKEALVAAGAGDVTIELLRDVTLDYNAREAYGTAETTSITINGNGYTLTLNQKDSDWSSIGLANANAKLILNNVVIEKVGYGDTDGAWNTHAINFTCNVEMNNATVNQSMSVQNGATLNNVTINEADGFYGLWIEGNGQKVTVTGGEINATNGGRGIKIADQYVDAPASVELAVTGMTFNTAKKAAILVSSTAGADITATDVNIENVVEDRDNIAWVDEEWAADFGEVTVNGDEAAQESFDKFNVSLEDGNGNTLGYYVTLEEALAAVGKGDYVIDIMEDMTLDYGARDVYGTDETTSITINGRGHTLTLNQTNSDWSSIGTKNPNSTIAFKNVTIKKSGYGATSGAWNTHAIIFSSKVEMNNVTVNNSIAVQNGATLNNVTINEAGEYYALWITGNGQEVTVNGGAINAEKGGRGIKIADQYVDAPKSVALTVTGTEFNTAKKAAIYVSSAAGADIEAKDIDIKGVKADKKNAAWVDEDWAEHYSKVTVNDVPAVQESINSFVASIKDANGNILGYYKTFAEAVKAADNGDTVVLLADDELSEVLTINKNITITGDYTISLVGNSGFSVRGDAEVVFANFTLDISKAVAEGDCIIGIGHYSENGTLTLSNMNVVGDGYSSAFAVFYVYTTSELNINNSTINLSNDNAGGGGFIKAGQQEGYEKDGTVNITDTEINLTNAKIGFLNGIVKFDGVDLAITGGANAINQSALTIIDSKLTITGCDGRALTVKNGDVTIVNSQLDFSNCTEGEIRFKEAFALKLDETSTLAECKIYADKKLGCVFVNDVEINGYEDKMSTVSVENGTVEVVNPTWAAKIGNVYYVNFADALAAMKAGDTVVLYDNVATSLLCVPADVTLDLNGKKLTVDVAALAYGSIIDTAEVAGGLVIGSDKIVHLQPDNAGYMPLYDAKAGCYRFFEYEVQFKATSVNTTKKSVVFGWQIVFTDADTYAYAYDLLASGTSKTDLKVSFTWSETSSMVCIFTAEQIQEFCGKAKEQLKDEGRVGAALTITLSGLDKIAGKTLVATADYTSSVVVDDSKEVTVGIPNF